MLSEAGNRGRGGRPVSRKGMMKPRFLLFAGALLASTQWAAAQAAPTSLGTFNAWSAYVSSAADGKVCFAASQPTSSKYSRTISRRGDTYVMITTIPAQGIRNQASTIIGFPFKQNGDVAADIDGQAFKMFTNDTVPETAWADPAQEAGLVEAMKKGSRMTIQSTSSRGTDVSDVYSLSGVTAALAAIAKECP